MGIEFYLHSLTGQHADEIARVLDTPFLTSGAVGKKVEAMLCDFFGTKHALLTNSWTNGAIAALLALGVKPGDEVIVPAMTFIATANVAELLGATPVFVDVDPETLLMTPEAVSAAVSPRTKAVIPVHLYGQMCDMARIRQVLIDRPDIALIEDAAHCFEGSRDGALPGKYSDMAIFSFYATKNVTCGEGGAIVTNRIDLVEALHSTRLHGMSKGAADRFRGGRYNHWDMTCLGTKANLPDLLAALLPPQISGIRQQLPDRQALADRYRRAFVDTPIRTVGSAGPTVSSAEHLLPIHVPPQHRDQAIANLNERGIGVTVNYRSVPTTTYYREKYGYSAESFPVSHEWGEGTLSLPLYPRLKQDEQDAVIAAVRDTVAPLCGCGKVMAAL